MDSINVVNLKIEKANAIKKYRRLKKIAILFRFIELFSFLIIISRFSVHLPVKFSFPSEYFRAIYAALFSPRFVFVIGNAIVITLFLKSGWNSNSYSNPDNFGNKLSADFYAEYVENRANQIRRNNNEFMVEKKICRSKSENLGNIGGEVPRPQLRRSATENCRKSSSERNMCPEDEMSGEEFRRKVEEFIARQQRSLREDFSAIVSC